MSNDKEIIVSDYISVIEKFICERRYHYALLINGKWGCGKTFFIQNELIPHMNDLGNKVLYISLYGVKSIDEISGMLLMELLKSSEKWRKILNSKIWSMVSLIASSALRLYLPQIGGSRKEIKKVIEGFPNYDKVVVIIDDLERCSCGISEVLGYINNFVEHSDVSVVLVANEEEIGKHQLEDNQELQMLVALDPRLDVEVETTEVEQFVDSLKTGDRKKQETQKTYTIKQIDKRINAIFNDNKRYRRMKEKVIGQTIQYVPDLCKVYTSIIEQENIKGTIPYDVLCPMVDEFVKIANQENHINIRTFQFFVEKAAILYDVIKGKYSDLYYNIFLYTYRSSVKYMMGEKMPVWDGDFGMQTFDKDRLLSTPILGFSFIDDLIVNNTINRDYIFATLNQYEAKAKREGQFSDDPYQLIRDWYLLSDEELEKYLEEIETNIQEGRYSSLLFSDILHLVILLRSYDLMPENCNRIITAMKEYITLADPSDIEDMAHEHFPLDGEAGRQYREYEEQIGELIKTAKKQSEVKKYINAIESDDWASKILQIIVDNQRINGHSFIYWIEPDLLVKKIAESSNYELNQFRQAVQCCYGDRFYYEKRHDDVEHLKAIKQLLQDVDKNNWGAIKKVYSGWIIGDIERYLEKIG